MTSAPAQSTSPLTGGDAVVAALETLGVQHVFGIVSVHNLPIYDAIERRGTIRAIGTRHEQGAVHAADGYARATGRLGVAITSTGPGAANAVPGLFEAGFASSPVLMITGQVASAFYGRAKGHLHEAERQRQMLASVTRRTETAYRTEDIARTLYLVADDVRSGRPQPGAVEIPIDQQYRCAQVDLTRPAPPAPSEPDPELLDRTCELLTGARRPLLWAGGGVISAGASTTLTELAELLDAPVITSINGRGAIPEDHPLCLGASERSDAIADVVADADVVLAVGTRFQAGSTRQWTLPIPGTMIHLDADAAVIGRTYPPTVRLVADALAGLSGIVRRLRGETRSTDQDFTARARKAGADARAAGREMIGADHARIMDTIRDLLPTDGPVVRDATVPAYVWGDRLLPILHPRTSLRPTSAAIGPGLPLALGAAVGSGRPTVVIQGDGGLMLSVGELATAVQYQLPIVLCVFNDRGYGVLRTIQQRTLGRNTGVELATPDFVALARAMGARGESVRGIEEFRPAFGRALDAGGPAVLDIDLGALTPLTLPA